MNAEREKRGPPKKAVNYLSLRKQPSKRAHRICTEIDS